MVLVVNFEADKMKGMNDLIKDRIRLMIFLFFPFVVHVRKKIKTSYPFK